MTLHEYNESYQWVFLFSEPKKWQLYWEREQRLFYNETVDCNSLYKITQLNCQYCLLKHGLIRQHHFWNKITQFIKSLLHLLLHMSYKQNVFWMAPECPEGVVAYGLPTASGCKPYSLLPSWVAKKMATKIWCISNGFTGKFIKWELISAQNLCPGLS